MGCSCAPGILTLISLATSSYGNVNSGCVGNDDHTYGYHLCPSRIRAMDQWGKDYSTTFTRDKLPAGDWSMAFDLGMGWKDSRVWLAWLVGRVRAGAYPDVCEIIGSLDGKVALYWRAPGWVTERYTGDGHVAWSHLGFWRDAGARDQSKILRDWQNNPGGGGMADEYTPWPRPEVVGNRPLAVLIADLWTNEMNGTSPYGPTGSSRTALLAKVAKTVEDEHVAQVAFRASVTSKLQAITDKLASMTGGGGVVDPAAIAKATAAELGVRISRPSA